MPFSCNGRCKVAGRRLVIFNANDTPRGRILIWRSSTSLFPVKRFWVVTDSAQAVHPSSGSGLRPSGLISNWHSRRSREACSATRQRARLLPIYLQPALRLPPHPSFDSYGVYERNHQQWENATQVHCKIQFQSRAPGPHLHSRKMHDALAS